MKEKKTVREATILVIGLGKSGLAAVRFLLRRGAAVVAVDQNLTLIQSDPDIQALRQQGVKILHESELHLIAHFDLVVASPGVPPTQRQYRAAQAHGIEVIGEMELACREITHGQNTKCIGITGTNGKTTVTLLLAHILNYAGINARAVGNVGIPLTTALDDAELSKATHYVIELSSFQLETMETPFLDHAVLLNITPDHLDRYASLQDYAKAKVKIAQLIKSSGKFYIESKCETAFHALFADYSFLTYGYGQEFVHTDLYKVYRGDRAPLILPLNYAGSKNHDLENLMATYCICSDCGISNALFLNALHTFKKPCHRLEFVRTLSGVHYYDDSKGTNIDAVVRAVEMLREPIILIAGGVEKGFPYHPWIPAFRNKVKQIYAIGEAAEKIKYCLKDAVCVELCVTLQDAVHKAFAKAVIGDTVLLSPGCSSFDMFKDYIHRGNEFKRIVNAL